MSLPLIKAFCISEMYVLAGPWRSLETMTHAIRRMALGIEMGRRSVGVREAPFLGMKMRRVSRSSGVKSASGDEEKRLMMLMTEGMKI